MGDVLRVAAPLTVAIAIVLFAVAVSARGSGSVAAPEPGRADHPTGLPRTDPAVSPGAEQDPLPRVVPGGPAVSDDGAAEPAVGASMAPAAPGSPAPVAGGDVRRVVGSLPSPPPGKPMLPVAATWDVVVADGTYAGVVVILPPPTGASVAVSIRRVPIPGTAEALQVVGRLVAQGLSIPVHGPYRPGDRLVVSVTQGTGPVLGRTFTIDLVPDPGSDPGLGPVSGTGAARHPRSGIVVDDRGQRTLLMPASSGR